MLGPCILWQDVGRKLPQLQQLDVRLARLSYFRLLVCFMQASIKTYGATFVGAVRLAHARVAASCHSGAQSKEQLAARWIGLLA